MHLVSPISASTSAPNLQFSHQAMTNSVDHGNTGLRTAMPHQESQAQYESYRSVPLRAETLKFIERD